MAAERLSEESIRDALKGAFDNLDTDGSGSLSKDELKAALEKTGMKPTDEQMESVMARCDEEGDGKLSFEEFANSVIALGIKVRIVMLLRQVFDALDADGSGYIEASDIKSLMTDAGFEIDEAELDTLVANCDTSGDGKISFEEFVVAAADKIELDFSDE